MEQAGKLCEAVELFNKIEIEHKKRAHTRRETIEEFEQRINKERRQKEAERLRRELLDQGLSLREVQEKLVETLQPMAGARTRAWQTPNPWNEGRFCRRKVDQEKLLALKRKPPSELDVANWRLQWAEHRMQERRALVAARRRAQALKAASQKVKTGSQDCSCFNSFRRAHHRLCPRFVRGESSLACDQCNFGVVAPSNPTYNRPDRNLCDSCYERNRRFGLV
jgi:hypothetical protein